jgi:hypothetical protein
MRRKFSSDFGRTIMNSILSRVITGIIGGIVGTICSLLIFFLLAYIVNAKVPDSGGMISGPNVTYAIFLLFGGVFGIILGLIIGIIQPLTVSKGILYGGLCGIAIDIFLFIATYNPSIGNSHNSISEIFEEVSIICVPIVCGAIIGLIVSLTNRAVLVFLTKKD